MGAVFVKTYVRAPEYEAQPCFWKDFQMFHRMAGSVMHKALPYSLLAAGWAILVYYYISNEGESKLFEHPYSYQTFSICVSFTLVFRTQISYNRYWESCTQIAFMSYALSSNFLTGRRDFLSLQIEVWRRGCTSTGIRPNLSRRARRGLEEAHGGLQD